jgi:hypothetical protein
VKVVVRPLEAVERTLTVSVDRAPEALLVTDDRLNVPLVRRGNPLTLRFTVLELFTAVIVTVYAPFEPRFTVCDVGDTLMMKSAAPAPVTVKVAVPEIAPDAAVMVATPCALAVARPVELIVATDVFEDVQFADDVMSALEPSE